MNEHISKRIPFAFAKKYGILQGEQTEHDVEIFHQRPLTPELMVEVRRYFHKPLKLKSLGQAEFTKRLTQVYQDEGNITSELMVGFESELNISDVLDNLSESTDLLDDSDDAPIIRLLNTVFAQAIRQRASDIHFETYENTLRIRFRIDGVLQEVISTQRGFAPFVVSRIKVMARLDIAEKRLPQDGRICLQIGGRTIDVRVSTLPSNHGERAVLRLLDSEATQLDLSSLGMNDTMLKQFDELIHTPHGIILVTGPTGSGKTTTLYAALTDLNDHTRNILTVEEPIEYNLPGIGQTQVNSKIGMTFASGLRSILRQDPDVVMLGEIRDKETAEIAVQASLTGHLVLSTLHTNTAIGAITRLRDVGVETFLLSSTLIGVLAQRLVRRLCENCKEAVTATTRECERMGIDANNPPQIYRAKGCDACAQLGYKGRFGIYELIPIDEEIRAMINRNDSELDIAKYAHKICASINKDGYEKVLAGHTSLEEVLRVIH